jgi:hypothetical protein
MAWQARRDEDTDVPLSDTEAQVTIIRSRDTAHREDRLLTILDKAAAMDEPKKARCSAI